MIECKFCEQTVPAEAKFCPFCGDQLGGVNGDPSAVASNLTSRTKKTLPIKSKGVGAKIKIWCGNAFSWLWKHFWVWLIFLIVIRVIFPGNASSSKSSNTAHKPSTYSSVQSNARTYSDGNYKCSQNHHNQAEKLKPSAYEETFLEDEQKEILSHSEELNGLKFEIESLVVTEDSMQYLIDDYNRRIDQYNTKLNSYQSDAEAHSVRVDEYNAKIDAYNKYLITNCSK